MYNPPTERGELTDEVCVARSTCATKIYSSHELFQAKYLLNIKWANICFQITKFSRQLRHKGYSIYQFNEMTMYVDGLIKEDDYDELFTAIFYFLCDTHNEKKKKDKR